MCSTKLCIERSEEHSCLSWLPLHSGCNEHELNDDMHLGTCLLQQLICCNFEICRLCLAQQLNVLWHKKHLVHGELNLNLKPASCAWHRTRMCLAQKNNIVRELKDPNAGVTFCANTRLNYFIHLRSQLLPKLIFIHEVPEHSSNIVSLMCPRPCC